MQERFQAPRHSQNGHGRPRGVEDPGDCSGPRLAERNTVNFRRGPAKHHLGKNPRASQTFFGGRPLTGCTLDLLQGLGFSLINRSEHQHLQKLVLFLVFTQHRVRPLFMRSVLLVPPHSAWEMPEDESLGSDPWINTKPVLWPPTFTEASLTFLFPLFTWKVLGRQRGEVTGYKRRGAM